MIGAIITIGIILFGFLMVGIYACIKISGMCSQMEDNYRLKRDVAKLKKKEYMRKWREKNREHYNEYQRNYQKGKRNEK